MDIKNLPKPKEEKKIGREPRYKPEYYMMMAKHIVDEGLTQVIKCRNSGSRVILKKSCHFYTGYLKTNTNLLYSVVIGKFRRFCGQMGPHQIGIGQINYETASQDYNRDLPFCYIFLKCLF